MNGYSVYKNIILISYLELYKTLNFIKSYCENSYDKNNPRKLKTNVDIY